MQPDRGCTFSTAQIIMSVVFSGGPDSSECGRTAILLQLCVMPVVAVQWCAFYRIKTSGKEATYHLLPTCQTHLDRFSEEHSCACCTCE